MKYINNKVVDLKIAYIGGGSRGWAWGLMSDLASCDDISGDVYLYDIDYEAAQNNEVIGNYYKDCEDTKSIWNYHAVKNIGEALTGADFVIISILPGTFDEMESDVHTPEKYGIYQSVGDTTGPGGIVRAMRTIPMYEEIAEAIKKYSPNAWVISYTNPMTLCVKTLYRVFPEIKAFGCCHEVFGTQKVLMKALEDICDIKVEDRTEIKVNPVAVNHFTWLTKAQYKNIDLFPVHPLRQTLICNYIDELHKDFVRADYSNIYAYYSKGEKNVLILVNPTHSTRPTTRFKMTGSTPSKICEIARDGSTKERAFVIDAEGFVVIEESFAALMTKTFIIEV